MDEIKLFKNVSMMLFIIPIFFAILFFVVYVQDLEMKEKSLDNFDRNTVYFKNSSDYNLGVSAKRFFDGNYLYTLTISDNPFRIPYSGITAISKNFFEQIDCVNGFSDQNFYCFKEKRIGDFNYE